jgi:hypothetical protein
MMDWERNDTSSDISDDCLSPSSTTSSSMKRLFDESRDTDSEEVEMETEIAETAEAGAASPHCDTRHKRLKSRCARVMASLSREIKLVEVLDDVRTEIQARRDMAQKARRVFKSEGRNLLVVLLALKWKSIALREEMEVEDMAYNARLKSHIYLKNQVLEAMNNHHQQQHVC